MHIDWYGSLKMPAMLAGHGVGMEDTSKPSVVNLPNSYLSIAKEGKSVKEFCHRLAKAVVRGRRMGGLKVMAQAIVVRFASPSGW